MQWQRQDLVFYMSFLEEFHKCPHILLRVVFSMPNLPLSSIFLKDHPLNQFQIIWCIINKEQTATTGICPKGPCWLECSWYSSLNATVRERISERLLQKCQRSFHRKQARLAAATEQDRIMCLPCVYIYSMLTVMICYVQVSSIRWDHPHNSPSR